MISWVDQLIVLGYLLGLMVMGVYLSRQNKTKEDYMLAGRSMPWIPIALSVAATMISANGFIGAPGWAYTDGISPYMVNIGVPLAVFIVMTTSMPMFYSLKLTSVYEYVEMRLGPISRFIAVLGFMMNSLIQISSMVFIPALILNAITGWPLIVVVPIVVLTAIVYTMLGGIKAVIWTDAIQMIIMWGGVLATILVILNALDLSFFETIEMAKNAGKIPGFDFTTDISKTNAFWATLFGGTIMWIRYFGFDQGQVQRIFTAKSLISVKRSLLMSTVLMNGIYFLFMIVGIFLFVFYEGRAFETSNGIMIDFILNHMPIGLVGLVIAGVFASAMSSVDSLLNSLTTVYVVDIHERYFKKTTSATSLKFSMLTSAFWGCLIIVITLLGFSSTSKSVLDVVGSYISNISGPMCGAFFLALLTQRANDKGTAIGTIIGFIAMIFLGKAITISWIWKPLLGMLLTFATGYAASLVLKDEKANKGVHQFTLIGRRAYLKDLLKKGEGTVESLPFSVDRYSMVVLGLFLIQYLIIAVISH